MHAVCMPNYRRVWVPGGTYFSTVNLLERRHTLLVDRMGALRHFLQDTRDAMRNRYRMEASCIAKVWLNEASGSQLDPA
jgi:REP element-mobilizing transposase RayT